MEVTHIGGLRFTVASQGTPGASYDVDFEGDPENTCQCEDFFCRRSPEIRKGGHLKDHTCKHVAACIEWIFWNKIYNQ